MPSAAFLLFVGLLGVVETQNVPHRDFEGGQERHQPSEGAEIIVNGFLDALTHSIEASDVLEMNELLLDNLIYHGCRSDYNKTQIVSYLQSLSRTGLVSFKLLFAHYTNGYANIDFIMESTTFGEHDISRFVLHNQGGRFKLMNGSSLNCPKTFLETDSSARHISIIDIAQYAAKQLFSSLENAIKAHNRTAVEDVFAKNFTFKVCKSPENTDDDFFDRDFITDSLAYTPTGFVFSFEIKSSHFIDITKSDDISVNAVFKTYPYAIDGDYHLKRIDGIHKIAQGTFAGCS